VLPIKISPGERQPGLMEEAGNRRDYRFGQATP